MPGKEFLELARELLAFGTASRHWRAVIIHAYYAVLLECRDAMSRWGLPPLARQQVHAAVRLRLVFSTDVQLKEIGRKLENLGMDRNAASYDLRALPLFASSVAAHDAVMQASDALALLDAIDKDPVRRSTAAGAIRP
jgi:hypothetical protein